MTDSYRDTGYAAGSEMGDREIRAYGEAFPRKREAVRMIGSQNVLGAVDDDRETYATAFVDGYFERWAKG